MRNVEIRVIEKEGKFEASYNGVVLTLCKDKNNVYKNVKNKLNKMGVLFNKIIIGKNDRVYTTKKLAKPGDFVKFFGDQIYQAYSIENQIRFRRVYG